MIDGKTVKVSYTAYLMNDWRNIVNFHVSCLVKSGMIDIADKITFFAYPINHELDGILHMYDVHDKITVVWDNQNEYEYRGVNDIIQDPFDYNLYFHTKGSSRPSGTQAKDNVSQWNNYITNFNIMAFRKCILYLRYNDCVGVDFSDSTLPHYHGNFWWTTREHANSLKDNLYVQRYKDFRMLYEMVLCQKDCRCASLCNSSHNLYKFSFSINDWNIEPKFFTVRKNKRCCVIYNEIKDQNSIMQHVGVAGVDFISVINGKLNSMIHGNWIEMQVPDELHNLPDDKKRGIVRILLPRYQDYERITFYDKFDYSSSSQDVDKYIDGIVPTYVFKGDDIVLHDIPDCSDKETMIMLNTAATMLLNGSSQRHAILDAQEKTGRTIKTVNI